jgi:hypothetical protein
MARLQQNITFIGRLGNLSAYTMQGSDKVIIRTKGGATKQKIKKSPSFAATRRHNTEWKGVTTAGKAFRLGIYGIKHLADYNISGPLNALFKRIQTADTITEAGKRSVNISTHHFILEGFNLNTRNLFDSIIRHPITCSIDRALLTATINIPDLISGISFNNPGKQPFYRLVVSFGAVSDYMYHDQSDEYRPLEDNALISAIKKTDWLASKADRPKATILLKPDMAVSITAYTSLIAGVGIEFGAPDAYGEINYIPYSGSGKVLKMG